MRPGGSLRLTFVRVRLPSNISSTTRKLSGAFDIFLLNPSHAILRNGSSGNFMYSRPIHPLGIPRGISLSLDRVEVGQKGEPRQDQGPPSGNANYTPGARVGQKLERRPMPTRFFSLHRDS